MSYDYFYPNLETYDYIESVAGDMLDYFRDIDEDLPEFSSEEEFRDWFLEEFEENGKIASANIDGSYTYSRYYASINLIGNFHYLEDCVNEYGASVLFDNVSNAFEPERLDVLIRMYLINDPDCFDRFKELVKEEYRKDLNDLVVGEREI